MSKIDLKTHEEIIADLDALTKEGKRFQVLRQLNSLMKTGPDKKLRTQLARLANRNQAYVLALRLLHPVVRDDREKIEPATAEALNIYATSLMWIGALDESQKCLQRIKGSTEALLTQAFVFFAQWDYQKSVPVLLKYIYSSQTTVYQKLVGRINLLAAYIAFGSVDQAKAIFEPLIIELGTNVSYRLLYGNCLELRAQISILEKNYEQALEFLNVSEKVLIEQAGRYLLYVNKWKAVAQLGLRPDDRSAQDELLNVKAEAVRLKNWETIRDCDFHFARLQNNQSVMQRILLATPYKGYRERVEKLFAIKILPTRQFEFCPNQILDQVERVGLNLNSISESEFFNSTSWPLIQLMTKDGYRPPRMGDVFHTLYAGEYFDPFTSPQRVRNSVFRFNDWAEAVGCEFRIKIIKGDFKLVGPAGLGITSTQRSRPLDSWQGALFYFKKQNQSRSFSSSDLAHALGFSQRSAVLLLKKALGSKKIEKLGSGRNCRYIFYSGRRSA